MTTDTTPTAAEVLDEVEAFITDFVVFANQHQPVAIALWVAHTYAFPAADTTPYLAVTGPDKRTGKSRLLEVLKEIALNAKLISSVTEAALYQIAAMGATLLCDEFDTIWKGRGERSEAVRGILNMGYRRGGTVIRGSQNLNQPPHEFEVFCPKAVAGIGTLPDTVADRSIDIRMQRKIRTETVGRFRPREVTPRAEALRAKLEGVFRSEDTVQTLFEAWPKLSDELTDRQQDCWEPLLAIAEWAGEHWTERARDAALALSERTATAESYATRLLRDIHRVWVDGEDTLFMSELIKRLHLLEDSPWADWDWRGHKINRALGEFDIKTKKVRLGEVTNTGFKREQFKDVWARYLDQAQEATQTSWRDLAEQFKCSSVPENRGDLGQTGPPLP